MVSAQDVPAQTLIKKLAEKLKQNEKIKPPQWAEHVKTGVHAERKPVQKDWWYTRAASILRKVYTEGKVGVGKLTTWYGGRKNNGSKPEHHADSSSNIVRKALQQLESAGLVQKDKTGRKITPGGQSLIHKAVLEIKKSKKQ